MLNTPHPALTLHNRARGALLGLAAGDALGTTLEFTPPGDPFTPRVTQIVGGGPFNLPAGGWTDDTSMALCLGQSLVACRGFNPRDQIERYLRWYEQGENSVTGVCFDIGGTTRSALLRYKADGEPMAGSTAANTAGNGSLMRLAPAAVAARSELQAIEWGGLQSGTTHAAREAVDACRLYARMLWRALAGASRAVLLDRKIGADLDLAPAVADVARGSYRERQPPQIAGSGYVVRALEAALWAFAASDDFASGAILAVNLGEDADTTGAIYGQIAGAHYGLAGIPEAWRGQVRWADRIIEMADALLQVRHGATVI
jgi:ADP-ribosyl-[dinitrogen reductase] hydrolase